jgi:hypothetical protein
MSAANRALYLRIALIVIGLIFIFGIYPLSLIWPSGWAWGQGHSHYWMMILGIYATLGVFLLMASSDPDAHKSIILVHCMVERGTRGDHGLAGIKRRSRTRASAWRCSRAASNSDRPWCSDANGLIRPGDDRYRHAMTPRRARA